MLKLEEKALKKKMEEVDSLLSLQPRLSTCLRLTRISGLAHKKPKTKPKSALSMKAHAKRIVNMKIKLTEAYIRRRKQKKKTHRVLELSSEKIQSLSLSLRGNC